MKKVYISLNNRVIVNHSLEADVPDGRHLNSNVMRKKEKTIKSTINMAILDAIMNKTRQLAVEYKKMTGKPLGVTGEVGEYQAAKLMGLTLTGARHPGYDALSKDNRRIQIKSRCLPKNAKPGQKIGNIKFDHSWDTVALIIMDESLDPISIYEAKRSDIKQVLDMPGSKARNERGSMGINKFKAIGSCVWPKEKRTKNT